MWLSSEDAALFKCKTPFHFHQDYQLVRISHVFLHGNGSIGLSVFGGTRYTPGLSSVLRFWYGYGKHCTDWIPAPLLGLRGPAQHGKRPEKAPYNSTVTAALT